MIESASNKELIIVGGPNGSGKTTLAKELVSNQDITYISADDIAYELAPDNPESVRVQAGKEFFKRLESSISNNENILIESTLAGKSLSSLIEKYKRTSNYSVTIVFIYLESSEVCVRRVTTRVKKGGHNVPVNDIIRRFDRSLYNFWYLYRQLSNKWHLFYNADDTFEEVASNAGQDPLILDEELFSHFKQIIKDHE